MTRLITDDAAAARLLVRGVPVLAADAARAMEDDVACTVFSDGPVLAADLGAGSWHELLIRDFAAGSQFDAIIDHVRRGGTIKDRTAVLARHGSGFHGADERSWSALSGNIHLTAVFAPKREIPHFETVFTALGAVACADAVDAILGRGRARIKWMNDVLVDGRKVGGVLAWTQVQDTTVEAAVLGIGLNVERTPTLARSPDVPQTASLADFRRDVNAADVVPLLLAALERHYDALLRDGWGRIVDAYRTRSAVVGREVAVRDRGGRSEIARGRVARIGDSLELYLEGTNEPVRSGRLVLALETR